MNFDRPKQRSEKKHRDGGLDAVVAIAWSDPIRRLPFVRESTVLTDDVQGCPPTPSDYRWLVGYAIHAPPEETETLADPDALPRPVEAVDPATVGRGSLGEPPLPTEGES